MRQKLALVSLVVPDYDEALAFYVDVLDFELVEDTYIEDEAKRWVVVAPRGGSGARLLLARASDDAQRSRIGNQTGGRVFLFLYTDDLARDHARLQAAGVRFVRPVTTHDYGSVAVFSDPFGNLWDLLQPSDPALLD